MQKKRVAIGFDRSSFDYFLKMAETRGESFSATIESVLNEVMRDDLAAERESH